MLAPMIYTVTANPSLDYITDVQDFVPGATNRTMAETLRAGGKGINVSIALHRLGIPSRALGFIAGFTGQEIERQVQALGIKTDFIRVQGGQSRINMKIRSRKAAGAAVQEETELNGSGPAITAADHTALAAKLGSIEAGDFLVLAGSIPASMPKTSYRDIMEPLCGKGINFVVDSTGTVLEQALACRPFLIKPNMHELGELFGTHIHTQEDAIPYARTLRERGARNVLVSLAEKGAVLVAEDGSVHRREAPACTPVNSVGAGDSMVAGFLAGWLETQDYAKALRYGICAGTASAASGELADQATFRRLLAETAAAADADADKN